MLQLDSATRRDQGQDIPVTLWTPVDDNGQAFTHKTPEDFQLRLDTAANQAMVAYHLDGSSAPSYSRNFAQFQASSDIIDLAQFREFFEVQLRITGNFSTFLLRSWGLEYLDNPMPLVRHDTGPVDLSHDSRKWVRELRIKAKTHGTLTVLPYWDGKLGTPGAISAGPYEAYVYTMPLSREDHGRMGRVVITTAEPSQVYWVEFRFNGAGRPIDKRVSLAPDAA
jgi:hypothetical protein